MSLTSPPPSIALLAVALLAACASVEPPLPGERETIFTSASDREAREQQETILPLPGLTIDLPTPARNLAWQQQGGSATHALPHPLVAGGGESGQFDVLFSVSAGSAAPIALNAAPVAADGRLFVLDGRLRVRAFDANTGERLWQRSLAISNERTASGMVGGLALENGRLFVATGAGTAAALVAETGEIIWRENTTTPFRNPPVAGGDFVFFLNHANRISARSQETGDEIWSHQGIQETTLLFTRAAPALFGDILFVAYNSGELYALRRENGAQVWSAQLPRLAGDALLAIGGQAAPVILGDRLINIQASGPTRSFSVRDGEILWTRDLAGLQTPVLAGDYMFMLADDDYLLCLRSSDGEILWARPLNEPTAEQNPRWHGPLLASGRLYLVSSAGEMAEVDAASGEILARRQMASGFVAPPVIADGTLFLLTRSMRLMALR